MAFRATARVSGSVRDVLLNQYDAKGDALRAEVAVVAKSLQDDLRGQTTGAGLGDGLAKAWQLLPPSGRFKYSALVFSKAVRLHWAFNFSETVSAREAEWLVLPTVEAVQLGLAVDLRHNQGGGVPRRWSNVAAAEERFGKLRFVPLRGGAQALLTVPAQGTGGRDLPLFLLIRQEHRTKRLDIEAAVARAQAALRAAVTRVLGA